MIDKIKSHFEDVKQAFRTLYENANIPFELNEEMSDMEQTIRTIFRNKNKKAETETKPEKTESVPKYDFAEGFVNLDDEQVKELAKRQENVLLRQGIAQAVQAQINQIKTEIEGTKMSLQGIDLEIKNRKEKKEKEGFSNNQVTTTDDYAMSSGDIVELSDGQLQKQRILIKENLKNAEDRLEVKMGKKEGFYSRTDAEEELKKTGENIEANAKNIAKMAENTTMTDAESLLVEANDELEEQKDKMGISQGKLKDTFLLECDPIINIDKNNRPSDPFTILYYVAVIVLNIPSVFIKFLSRFLFKLFSGKSLSSSIQTVEDAFDTETIRKTFVEMGYIFLTFWLTYNVLFFSINPKVLKSKGPWTKFKWIPINIFKKIAIVLYYPTEYLLRTITENINPSFEYMKVEKYKPINFMWVFFVSMFFIYNYLPKFRETFFKSFITRDQFPTCDGMVTLLLVMRYLIMYFGPSFSNAVSWYVSIPSFGLTRIIPFIFVVIMVHVWAGAAQFAICMSIFYYILGPFFIKESGFTTTPTEMNKLYSHYAGAGERSCTNTGASFMEKLNMLLGTYVLHEIKPTSKIKWSTFYYCIMILFFIYRMIQIESITDSNVRIFTGIFGGVGIVICLVCISMIHFFKKIQKSGLQIGESNQFKINVPNLMEGIDTISNK
tara:strand:+ start:879 stop:2873 length:1995 start_codon:yes stop_codon:yes gene_type:complete